MAENFYTIITAVGKAKIANAQVLGQKVDMSHIAVGDGGGNPTESQTTLKNEVWRGNISSIDIDPQNPSWIVMDAIIPSDVGGFTVREVGVFDSAGDLIAIGKYPETYKPVLAEGSAKDLFLRMIIEVSNASSVTLKIDPTMTIASRKYVDDKFAQSVGPINQAVQEIKDGTLTILPLQTEDKTLAGAINELEQKRVAHLADDVLHRTQAEKDKLAGIEQNANNYIHPVTHPASMITDTPTKRFGTDAKFAEWDAKETPAGAQTKVDALAGTGNTKTVKQLSDQFVAHEADDTLHFTPDEKTKLAGIDENANNYAHPITAGNKHIPSGGSPGQFLAYGGSSGVARWEDVQLEKMLYESGIHYTTFVKGYDSHARDSANPNSMEIDMSVASTSLTDISLVTDLAMSLTGFNAIVLDILVDYVWASAPDNEIALAISTTKSGDIATYDKRVNFTNFGVSTYKLTMPIDTLSGNYYIRVHGRNKSGRWRARVTSLKLLK